LLTLTSPSYKVESANSHTTNQVIYLVVGVCAGFILLNDMHEHVVHKAHMTLSVSSP
jgi:hypothetical protein